MQLEQLAKLHICSMKHSNCEVLARFEGCMQMILENRGVEEDAQGEPPSTASTGSEKYNTTLVRDGAVT